MEFIAYILDFLLQLFTLIVSFFISMLSLLLSFAQGIVGMVR